MVLIRDFIPQHELIRLITSTYLCGKKKSIISAAFDPLNKIEDAMILLDHESMNYPSIAKDSNDNWLCIAYNNNKQYSRRGKHLTWSISLCFLEANGIKDQMYTKQVDTPTFEVSYTHN